VGNQVLPGFAIEPWRAAQCDSFSPIAVLRKTMPALLHLAFRTPAGGQRPGYFVS
jgi:hypothetical protein